MIELTIIADTNDADYVQSVCEITQEELDRFMPILLAIHKAKRHYNWVTSEYSNDPTPEEMYPELDPNLIEEFSDEYIPCGENGIGVHTIATLKVRRIIIEEETDYLS